MRPFASVVESFFLWRIYLYSTDVINQRGSAVWVSVGIKLEAVAEVNKEISLVYNMPDSFIDFDRKRNQIDWFQYPLGFPKLARHNTSVIEGHSLVCIEVSLHWPQDTDDNR